VTTAQLKETPLAASHRKDGARMVDFAGWNMPVQYRSIIQEHQAVRRKVGLFDVSHMGEFTVSGAGAPEFLQYVIANDLRKLSRPNMALYTQFVMPDGGTVDDLIVYRRRNDFLLVVNASNIEKDWNWVSSHAGRFNDVKLDNVSDETALLALQGPSAAPLFKELVGEVVDSLHPFAYEEGTAGGIKVGFGRTGYTGEDGFEIFVDPDRAAQLWELLLDRGRPYGIEPCGLGARDTLRLEAGLPLYGHELDEKTSPLESGLGWSVKLDKGDFLGREALLRQQTEGLKKVCVCLRVEGKALPRQGYPVLKDGQPVGAVSSGSQGIFVGYPIAMAFVPPSCSTVGSALAVEIRNAPAPATVVRRPFYKRSR